MASHSTLCAHCALTFGSDELVTLAGGVRVCDACWERQHQAGVLRCARCAGQLSATSPRLSASLHRIPRQRPVCVTCRRELKQLLEPPYAPKSVTWDPPDTVRNDEVTLNGFSPSQIIYDEARGITHPICTCISSLSPYEKCEACLDAEYPPVTEDELDYVRRSLGAP